MTMQNRNDQLMAAQNFLAQVRHEVTTRGVIPGQLKNQLRALEDLLCAIRPAHEASIMFEECEVEDVVLTVLERYNELPERHIDIDPDHDEVVMIARSLRIERTTQRMILKARIDIESVINLLQLALGKEVLGAEAIRTLENDALQAAEDLRDVCADLEKCS